MSTNMVRLSLIEEFEEEGFELLRLTPACEELLLLGVDGLAGIAAVLPLAVLIEDKGLNLRDGGGGNAGVGVAYDSGEALLVGADTEDGFLDAERFEELGGEDAVGARGTCLVGQ